MKHTRFASKISLSVILLMTVMLFSTHAGCADKAKELNILTWSIYCPDFATKSFEEKYGVKVNCAFFKSNEDCWNKMQAGGEGADIIQPSNHMVAPLANAGLIAPIDLGKITNYEGVLEGFRKADYNTIDGKQYSVPFTFGVPGIGYRTDMIKEPPTSWAALWDERYKGKIMFTGKAGDAFYICGMFLGLDISRFDEDTDIKIEMVKAKLKEQTPLLLESKQKAKDLLASGDIWITSAGDGWIHKMQLEGLPVAFVVPQEGTAIWIDQFCIPAKSQNMDLAHKWIDHMLSPEIAAQMIQKMGYLVVNAKATSALPPEWQKIMKFTDEETKRMVPYPTVKPETTEKMIKALQDVRGK